jgi:hypothetical protein
VPIHKWPIYPVSALHEKLNPRNPDKIGMPAVKFFVRLDLDPICLFLDGHQLICKGVLKGTQKVLFPTERTGNKQYISFLVERTTFNYNSFLPLEMIDVFVFRPSHREKISSASTLSAS